MLSMEFLCLWFLNQIVWILKFHVLPDQVCPDSNMISTVYGVICWKNVSSSTSVPSHSITNWQVLAEICQNETSVQYHRKYKNTTSEPIYWCLVVYILINLLSCINLLYAFKQFQTFFKQYYDEYWWSVREHENFNNYCLVSKYLSVHVIEIAM